MTLRTVLLAALLLLSGGRVTALDIREVRVDVREGRYFLHGESLIEAPARFIFQILMDYDNFHRITSGITETRFLPADENGRRLGYTRVDSCILFFCRKILAATADRILTEAIPERSDFAYNRTQWLLEPVENGTLVTYDAEVEPDFWFPRLIGEWAIRRKLENSAREMGLRIEYLSATGQPLSALNE